MKYINIRFKKLILVSKNKEKEFKVSEEIEKAKCREERESRGRIIFLIIEYNYFVGMNMKEKLSSKIKVLHCFKY